MVKATNTIQGNPHKVISWFFSRNSAGEKGVAQYNSSDEREISTTKNTLASRGLIQIWWKHQKIYREAKVKRIQHHQNTFTWASLVAQRLKRLPPMRETWVRSLGREVPLEKEMATHSSILAWRIPRMEEPGKPQFTGPQRVGHDWATSLQNIFTANAKGTSLRGKEISNLKQC